jgi:aminoglycoside 6'-N-acetyltransferase
MEGMVVLRPMREADVPLVQAWLGQPHVARWYLSGSTLAVEVQDVRDSLDPDSATTVLIVEEDSVPIGWCQWYRCDAYPEYAAGVGAQPGDVGIDYAIGEVGALGRGVGTVLVAELLKRVWHDLPGSGIIVDPEAANLASRRELEKNGFGLVDERVVASEPTCELMAIYRRPPPAPRG